MVCEELRLEQDSPVERSRASKVMYRKSLSEVVKDLESHGMTPSVDSERKLKRWIAKGRHVGDLPPFDCVHQLADWWRRMQACGQLTWKVPDYLLEAERAASVTPSAPSTLPPMSTVESMLSPVVADGDETTQQALAQLNSFAAGFLSDMQAARENQDDRRFWTAYERYEKVAEKIRKWQATALAVKKASGEYVEERKVEEVLAQVLSVASMSFTNVLFALGRMLAPDRGDAELREIVLPMRDRCFAHLKSTKFASVTPS